MAVSWPLFSCIALEKGLSHIDAGKYRPSQYINMYVSSTGNIQQEGWPAPELGCRVSFLGTWPDSQGKAIHNCLAKAKRRELAGFAPIAHRANRVSGPAY